MPFESGFQAGMSLPMVKDPVAELVNNLMSGFQAQQKLGSENQLRQAQAQKAGREAEALQLALQGFNQDNGSASGMGNSLKEELIRKAIGLTGLSPETQQNLDLEKIQRQEQLKKQIEKKEGTTASITQSQTSSLAANQALNPINELLEVKGKNFLGQYLGGDIEKKLDSNALLAADNYLKAKNINPTVENLTKFHKLFRRGTNESVSAYHNRLKKYKNELEEIAGIKKSSDSQFKKNFNSQQDWEKYIKSLSKEQLAEYRKQLGGE
ncbi:hypothetical protein YTPLAS21_19080 [Candidatus Nitrosocosmicus sp.]|nr:hypothetical protein YTPLAS21_19080 [Candidatus Nitrosocosmicus sp.]